MDFDLSACEGLRGDHLAACVGTQIARQAGFCVDSSGDRWSVLRPGQCGDCEDHAVTVGEAMISLGADPSDFVVLITKNGSGELHAVLLMRGKTVIDNGSMHSVRSYPRIGTRKWEMVRARVDLDSSRFTD